MHIGFAFFTLQNHKNRLQGVDEMIFFGIVYVTAWFIIPLYYSRCLSGLGFNRVYGIHSHQF